MAGFDGFHPAIDAWFARRFAEGPTPAQERGWPLIAAGQHTLIAAPTGSGKTLAAFLVGIDQLLREACEGSLPDETRVIYVSPLKALAVDVAKNLVEPLAEMHALAAEQGRALPEIRVATRSGDTSPAQRAAQTKRPPHLLVTTPESLYLLLTAEKSREKLRAVRTVIVDEIHAVARDKRGSHLAITLERLAARDTAPPQRIGLSATQRPIETLARLLVGAGADRSRPDGSPACEIVDEGHRRALDLAIEVPGSELAAVASHEQWGEILERIAKLASEHRTTLVFSNTRRLAERIAHQLRMRDGRMASKVGGSRSTGTVAYCAYLARSAFSTGATSGSRFGSGGSTTRASASMRSHQSFDQSASYSSSRSSTYGFSVTRRTRASSPARFGLPSTGVHT